MLKRLYCRACAYRAARRLEKMRRLAHGAPRDVELQIALADAVAAALETRLRYEDTCK
jgi:hypothetical protein